MWRLLKSSGQFIVRFNTWQEDRLRIAKGKIPENMTALCRFAIVVIRRHATEAASTIRKLRCYVRMVLDYLRLRGNTRGTKARRAKYAAA